MFTLFSFIFAILCGTSHANDTNHKMMNGYSLDMFPGFEDWQLVTVRYRKDTEEMRFTYANPLAWKTLTSKNKRYPDNAIFAKISIRTQEDPAFPSSVVPQGARRIQFMVRNASKHKDTDGWGYALFDSSGNKFPGEDKAVTMACAVCHRLVPDRDFVFSMPLDHIKPNGALAAWQNRLKFKEENTSTLPARLKYLLPATHKKVHLLQSEMSTYYFSGTLDEVRPLLAKEASQRKAPTALLSKDKKSFSVVFPATEKNCSSGEISLRGVHTLGDRKDSLYTVDFCHALGK